MAGCCCDAAAAADVGDGVVGATAADAIRRDDSDDAGVIA